jgi:glycosyltransferase involved in cell wall biosynthesis
MQLSLVTAIPFNVERGSGTFVAGLTLQRGLEEAGHTVRVVRPRGRRRPFGYTAHRFRFNLQLTATDVADSDIVLGLDMDGFRLAGRCHPFVCYPMGVIADEARFEHGVVARLLQLQACAERRSATRADMVITTSEYSRQRLHDLYGIPLDRMAVVPPAFDVGRWSNDLRTAQTADTRPLRPTVLCVAHMYPRKNIAALLRASAFAGSAIPDLEVRIVGDGPERRRLERLANTLGLGEHVVFLGALPYRHLLGEFAACDVFCLPSLQEGFGIVFLEAMASGKTIVACRASSTPELVADGVNGLLAEPGDVADLAAKLIACLDDAAMRGTMERANRTKAEEYGLARTTAALVDLLHDRLL